MAELTISADEIQGAIEEYVAGFEADTEREEIGTVIDAGDGIAHVEGLPSVMTQELLEFPGGVLGVALNLDEHSIGAVILGDFEKIERANRSSAPARFSRCRSGTPSSAAWSTRSGSRSTVAARSRPTNAVAHSRLQAPSVVQRQGVERAAADRHQGHRLADPDRPRPASADHRRPQDRQDRGVRRHHPQPAAELGDRRREAAGALRVRRDRPEGHHDRQCAADPRRRRRDGLHHHRRRAGFRLRRLQMACAVHRFGDRPALDVRRQARADRVRRPHASRPRPTAPSRCCCAARRAARPTRATCSTCIRGCWNAARSCPTSSAAVR